MTWKGWPIRKRNATTVKAAFQLQWTEKNPPMDRKEALNFPVPMVS
jgi:hypothetical protein